MGLRFLSQPWLDEGKRVLAASDDFAQSLGETSVRILTHVTQTPSENDQYVFQEFDRGKIKQMRASAKGATAQREVDFRLTGKYDTFCRLQQGTLSVQGAYFQRLVRLEGDLQKALRFAPTFMLYNRLMQRIDTEF